MKKLVAMSKLKQNHVILWIGSIMRSDRALVTFSSFGAEKFAPGTRFVQLHLVQGHAGENERKAPGRNPRYIMQGEFK